MTDHPRAIDIGDGGNLTDQSAEVARLWVTHEGGASVWIDAGVLTEPNAFGILIAEALGHASIAYAEQAGGEADEMLSAIVAGLTQRMAAGFGPASAREGETDQ